MQAAFQWRFPGLFLHIILYTFFYFHAASDPAHLLSQHFGCYCCPAFSLASPFVFPFFSYLTLHLPAHFLYQHFGCYYCLIIFPRFPFHSFPFSHIYDVFLLLIFYHNYQFGCRFIISDCSPCVFSPLLVSSLLLILYDNFPVCYRCPVFSLTFGFPLPPRFPSAHLLSPPSGCYLSLWLPPSFLFFAL